MVFHRGHIISALNESGVPTDKNSTDRELIKKVVDHLGDNKAFTAKITGYIALFNNIPTQQRQNADSFWNGEGGTASGGGETAVPTGAFSALAGAIGDIFSFAKGKQDAKSQAEANRMALAQSLLANQPQQPSNAGLIIGITLGAAAIGAIIYFAMRHQPAKACGGMGITPQTV